MVNFGAGDGAFETTMTIAENGRLIDAIAPRWVEANLQRGTRRAGTRGTGGLRRGAVRRARWHSIVSSEHDGRPG